MYSLERGARGVQEEDLRAAGSGKVPLCEATAAQVETGRQCASRASKRSQVAPGKVTTRSTQG
eukprot:1983356-Lingulodinium_polyedra.AAC.1